MHKHFDFIIQMFENVTQDPSSALFLGIKIKKELKAKLLSYFV